MSGHVSAMSLLCSCISRLQKQDRNKLFMSSSVQSVAAENDPGPGNCHWSPAGNWLNKPCYAHSMPLSSTEGHRWHSYQARGCVAFGPFPTWMHTVPICRVSHPNSVFLVTSQRVLETFQVGVYRNPLHFAKVLWEE